MKKALFALLLGTLSLPLMADFVESSPSGSTSGTFRGVITAVEDSRDSFTVESDEKTVKMFAVSPERKASLTVGAPVTVTYVEGEQWPLKTLSISQGSANLEK